MIISYPILANPEVEPHAPNTYQSKLVPGATNNVADPHYTVRKQAIYPKK